MARKASLIVIWPSFKNKMATISRLMTNRVILLKGLISPLPLLLGVRNEKQLGRKSWTGHLFQMLNLTFDSFFNVTWGILLQKSYISLSSPLLLILRLDITTVEVVLFLDVCSTIVIFNGHLSVQLMQKVIM